MEILTLQGNFVTNDTLVHRFYVPPDESLFIFGPRGTGKSAWIRTHISDSLMIDLLDDITFRQYISHPEYRQGECYSPCITDGSLQ